MYVDGELLDTALTGCSAIDQGASRDYMRHLNGETVMDLLYYSQGWTGALTGTGIISDGDKFNNYLTAITILL